MESPVQTKTPQQILLSILERMNVNVKTFALGMKQPYSKVFDISRGRTRTFSSSIIRSMVEYYNINESYLFTGEGEMFLNDTLEIGDTSDDITNSFLRVTSKLSNRNHELSKEIERLQKLLEENGIAY